MLPISATIKPGDSGNDVVNLQQVLQFLYGKGVFKTFNPPNSPTAEELNALVKKMGSEQTQQVFGDATRLLIRYFQIQRGPGDNLHGLVEEKTAQRINALLSELGAPIDSNYVVTGIITNAKTHAGLANTAVRAFDADGAIRTLLGQTQTDTKGRYRIEFHPSVFQNTPAERGGPDLIIEVFSQPGDVSLGISMKHNNCQQATTIDLAVMIPDLNVFGNVIDSNKQLQKNIIVTAWDRDLRKRQLLGSAITDEKGNYSINYNIDQFVAADVVGRNKPWLIIEAQRKANGEIEQSIVIKPDQVERFQRVDLLLKPAAEKSLSEWEQITQMVSPLLAEQADDGDNLQPGELNDDDIQFIASETALEYSHITAWSLAHVMQDAALVLFDEEHALEAMVVSKSGGPLFYGLIRQLSVSVLQQLFLKSADSIVRALGNAVAQKQIPLDAEDEIDTFVATLVLLRQLQTISPQAANDHPIAKITSLLKINLSTPVKLAALALVEQGDTSDPDIFLSLHKKFPDDIKPINRFIQGVRLHQLTNGNATLIKTLANHISNDGDSIVSLAGLDIGGWNIVATESRVDLPVAMAMLNSMELAYPVEALQLRIESKQLAELSGEINNGIKQLLKDNPKKVQDYIQGREKIPGVIEDVTEKALSSVGLFARLSLPYEVSATLIAANIDTPQLIIHHGRETLRELLKEKYGEVMATHWSDATVKVIDDLKIIGTGVIAGTIQYQYVPPGWYIKPDKPAQEIRENIPGIPALLGDLDECICAPCESMLGQPAYLVDLLQLLDKPNANNQAALAFLRARRPDIFGLPLGCEQAETPVQHINLVIEMFEDQLRPRQYPNPYMGIDVLYKQLAQQPYPWFMPFDKWQAQESAYLQKLNITAHELNELTQNNLTEEQIAANLLGIPSPSSSNTIPVEWKLLTNITQGTELWNLYGFSVNSQGQVSLVDPASGEVLANQPVQDVVKRISVLLARTGLSLDEFEDVIRQPYVGNLSIENRAQCKTSQMILNTGTQSLDICLDRIHRIVRLQRKLGWAFADINAVLAASTQSTNFSSTIIHIARIKSLADTYHLSANLLCHMPQTYGAILRTLGFSRAQRLCLEKILGIDPAQTSFSIADLNVILTFNTLIGGTHFSPEELGLVFLPRSDLQSIFIELPGYIKNDIEIAATAGQLVNTLQQEQMLLHKQLLQDGVQEDPELPSLEDDAIITLIATSLNISEQDARSYAFFKTSTNETLIETLRAPHTIISTSTLEVWLNCVFRMEGIRNKFDTGLWDALIKTFDWVTVIAGHSVTGRSAIMSLVNWLWLAQPERAGPLVIAGIITLSMLDDPAQFNTAINIFSKRFEMDASIVNGLALLVGLSPASINSFNDAALVKRFFGLLEFARQWRADSIAITNLRSNSVAQVVESLLRIKHGYTDEEWIEIKRQIENPVRQQKRNALVAELVRRNPQLKNANDIYEHYLIDPLVEPCMNTTRILEAITATQLFAQRVLFGVERYRDSANNEHGLLASDALRSQWTWMRNYRVWEANRKVFLFPENWLYPELRDDKSSSFKLLETELGKGELNGAMADAAFGRFLDDIARVGQIQVVSMYEDVKYEGSQSGTYGRRASQESRSQRNLYIVGKTPSVPAKYFWRKSIAFGSPQMQWTPWQEIELDIQGDHLQVFVLNEKLMVSWPLITRISRKINADTQKDYWHIEMCYSSFDGYNWCQPIITGTYSQDYQNPNDIAVDAFEDERYGFSFRNRVLPDDQMAVIECFSMNKIPGSALQPPSSPAPSREPLVVTTAGTDLIIRVFRAAIWNGNILPSFCQKMYESYLLHIAAEHRLSSVGINLNSAFFDFLDVFGDSNVATKYDDQMRDWSTTLNPVLGKFKSINATPGIGAATLYDQYIEEFVAAGNANQHPNYAKFVTELLSKSSQRIISIQATVQSTLTGVSGIHILPQGTSVELQIGSNPNRINTSVGSSIELDVAYGQQSEVIITLYWRGLSAAASLGLVAEGKKLMQELNFKFDLQNNDPSHYGIVSEADRSYSRVFDFHIRRNGQVSLVKSSGLLEKLVSNTVYFTNGFLEQDHLNGANELDFGNPAYEEGLHFSGYDQVFDKSLKQHRFYTVGAAGVRNYSQNHQVWSYAEGDTACLVDLKPFKGGRKIYPNVWLDETNLAANWFSSSTIPVGARQINTYGANKLPANTLVDPKVISGELTFNADMPNACYSWEVFLHAPLLIADQLSKQHQFEDAERWLRYVFDPASTEPGTDASRFLKFRVFKELNTHTQVVDDLKAIAQTASGRYSDSDVSRINTIIERWRELPFRPFVIARDRHIAFLWRTLFAYIDNLITWADSLYRRDTRESNNEAMMLYVLAYRILGRRPKQMAGASKKVADTYDKLASKLDAFSNYWVDVATRAGGYVIYNNGARLALIDKQPPTSAGTLLFCMPHNDKLDRYWEVIEDRLFNLRHCRNIEGIARDLPLVDSPVDPELLVRATAAGLDLNSVIAGLYAAPPHYRYGVLAARAMELVGETKSLGAAMLSALEKHDAEYMVQLRSTNEIALLQQIGELKKLQIKEAEANITALRAARKSAETRYSQYQRLLGLDGIAPDEGAAVGEVAMLGQLDRGNSSPRSGMGLITEEAQQYNGVESVNTWSTAATISKLVAGGLHASASIVAAAMSATPLPNPPKVLEAIGNSVSNIGDSFSFVSQAWRIYAEQQGMLAGHLRRRDDWAFQNNQVLKELKQIDKQILANQIRIDITAKELDNHQLQLEQSHAVDDVLRNKFTNAQLYQWMSTELGALYNKAYRMALEMARKAQSAAELELGLEKGALDIVRNDHWKSMKQGLLAGERLYQDLKRLDVAYLDQNKRELELTKHISLRRLDPAELIKLKFGTDDNGVRVNRCEFDIPEWLFDLDTPGHYLRRIKSVALSIPCVVGPYTSIHCKLTLVKSSIQYDRTSNKYTDCPITLETVVTSTANADSGLFETQLQDERFLPFENAGAIGRWRIELPDQFVQFDYSTISDVILTLRYTARDGGEQLSDLVKESLAVQFNPAPSAPQDDSPGVPLLLSCRSDFFSEWTHSNVSGETLEITLTKDFLPYWMRVKNIGLIGRVQVFAIKNNVKPGSADTVTTTVLALEQKIDLFSGSVNQSIDTTIKVAEAAVSDVLVLLMLKQST
ncbi:Tc toxin subunit A-related protein [Cellvibrio mixtus]|uniref:Tc toxin subunit A-related protein n=1 Tax=Cellvibrio mixtus TaxID=39650 RepID=UPI000587F7FA|nr:neuraminidase-like domain-containing protein [Cellvibrio mixtus]